MTDINPELNKDDEQKTRLLIPWRMYPNKDFSIWDQTETDAHTCGCGCGCAAGKKIVAGIKKSAESIVKDTDKLTGVLDDVEKYVKELKAELKKSKTTKSKAIRRRPRSRNP